MAEKTPGQVINELVKGKFTKLAKVSPHGTLEARKMATGVVTLYWRVTIGGKQVREPIGIYHSVAPPKSLAPTMRGFSVAAALRAAEALATKHHNNLDQGGIVGVKAAEVLAQEAARLEVELQARHTLRQLLSDYCDHIEALGRNAHKDARSIFALHVVEPWPDVASLPAKEVTLEQVADMMRLTREKGHDRTANKLRSYVRAAYATALKARSSNTIPVKFKAYQVSQNPAADTAPDEAANRPDKNPLGTADMRVYWACIKDLPGLRGAVLRLHLLSGGQRIAQLVRLKTCDVIDGQITLYDGKGRPGKPPRPHTLPLTAPAALALAQCQPSGEWALSTNGGDTHLSPITLSGWAVDAVGDRIKGFNTKRVRSGVETLLASARVSAEVRGRIQSHGIAGVQARHYDGHDYQDEKREALDMLHNLLTRDTTATVVTLRKSA